MTHSYKQKVINDPVYGFITINHPLIFNIIAHPYFQRLRRIQQMALANLVYPGAVHTRLHHCLGAYHFMGCVLQELKAKGTHITEQEEVAAKAAILLHDVGHGPFSHALEYELLPGIQHETMSLRLMQAMNHEFNGALQMAIDIFTDNYPKKFLHQLVSGQLDVDRMDYLMRDSFFTGVSEGIFGYDRILKMLVVKNDELLVEEKGIYSIEKFLIARRQMYWQVYLHKTVLAAEKTLVNIIKRVKHLHSQCITNLHTSANVDYFLFSFDGEINSETINKFCSFDDVDISYAIKKWSTHSDKVLQQLCHMVLNRQLPKCKIQSTPFDAAFVENNVQLAAKIKNINPQEAQYFVFTGKVNNTMYKVDNQKINVLFKDGTIKDISSIDNALIHEDIAAPVSKYFMCSL